MRHKPHLLYVITDLELGGVPLHLHRLTRVVLSRGYRCVVASLRAPGVVGDMLRGDGVEVLDCGGRGGWDYSVLFRLGEVMDQVHPDLVHSFLFHANFAARWAGARRGLSPDQILCEIQTVEVERRWHLTVDRWTHRGCRYLIANSPSVVDHLAIHARIPRDRLRLVRGGIDPAPIQHAMPIERETLGIDALERAILWVGRLDPVKGVNHLIDAFSILSQRTPAILLLAGDGPARRSLQRQAADLGLSHRIRFLGNRQDVPRLLKSADVFAFPSRTEGLPNALMEAMVAGCAIVTTTAPGCRDLIQDERTGLLVSFGDAAALAQAIGRLLHDPSLAARLGANAAEAAVRDWNIESTYDSYLALYEDALGTSEGRR